MWATRLVLALWLVAATASAQPYIVSAGRPRGAAVTPVTQIIVGGSATTVAQNLTRYGTPSGVDANALTATESSAEQIFLAGTISNLYVTLSADIGATGVNTMDVSIMKCPGEDATPCVGGATPVTCQVVGTAGTSDFYCTDTTNSLSVSAGDRITVKVVTSTVATSSAPRWAFMWTGTNSNESMMFANVLYTSSNTQASGMIGPSVVGTNTATRAGLYAVTALTYPPDSSFVVTGLYARPTVAVSAGCIRVDFAKDGTADSTFRADVTGSTLVTDLTGSISTAQFDALGVNLDNSSSSCGSTSTATGGSPMAVTLRLTHSSRHYVISSCAGGGTAVTRHSRWTGNSANSAASEIKIPATTITDSAVQGSDPGASGNYVFNLRDDASNITGSTLTLTNGVTTNAATPFSVGVGAGSLVDWEWTVTSTPASFGIQCLSIGGV